MFGSEVACKLAYSEYHVVTNGYGGEGFLLDKESDIQLTLDSALKSYNQGHSVLVNCLVGRTGFRDGSISV